MYKKTDESVDLHIGIYRDDIWDEIADSKKLTCNQKRQKAAFMKSIRIPFNALWSETVTAKYSTQTDPTIWYFVIMDCEHETHSKHKTMPKIEIEFNIRNNNGEEHFSYE